MANGNSVTVVGNLTRDPELRFTSTGAPMAVFGVAVNRRWQNRQTNEWEEETSFFNCTAWREQAENVAESLHKGDRIVVTGRLQQRSWESEEGKRSVVEIQVDEMGPSLRWATANVVKNERTDSPGGGGGGGGGSESARPVPNEPAGYTTDEEPF